MKRYDEILYIFQQFNNAGLDYFVLRDYSEIDRIVNSKDIDIYVEKKCIKAMELIFRKAGWVKRIINNNKYPHIQYFKMFSDGIAMFDVVYKLCYGKDNYQYIPDVQQLSSDRKIGVISICNEELAVSTFVFHVLFDKNELSDKNAYVLGCILDDYEKSIGFSGDNEFYQIGKKILESNGKVINEYKDYVLKQGKLNKTVFLKYGMPVLKKMLNVMFKITRRLSNKTVCFIGLDGSGKSSTIESLSRIYDKKSVVVYMGMKDFKSKATEELVYTKRNTPVNKIKKMIYLYIEMWKRYVEYRYSGKVVIFDRYVDDIYLSGTGITNKIYSLFFKLLFPKPRIKFYMYCDVDTSLKRKNDILDEDIFRSVKSKYDKVFLGARSVYSISTDDNTKEEAIEKVIDVLNRKLKEGIF